MKFTQHQAQSRRTSRLFILLYTLAVSLIAFITAIICAHLMSTFYDLKTQQMAYHQHTFVIVFFLTIGIILTTSLLHLSDLKKQLNLIADNLNAKPLNRQSAQFKEKQLLNIIEETAIAAQVPTPQAFLLPERSINAFVAGFETKRAQIFITYGALYALNRQELQAIIAHELSHIRNGDTRLNMQMAGWLFGLQMLTHAGNYFFGGTQNSWDDFLYLPSNQEPKIILPTMPLGFILIVLGFFGSFIAKIIQAAVCRQREYLADACAVQYTRQNEPLASALYKISVSPYRAMNAVHADEYAHFMFNNVRENKIFATHPAPYQRICRIAPQQAKQWREHIEQTAAEGFIIYHDHSPYPQFSSTTQTFDDTSHLAQQHTVSHILRRIERILPAAQSAHSHWLEAENDSERLAVALPLLFSDGIKPETQQQWQTTAPNRLAYLAKLQKQPLDNTTRHRVWLLLIASLPALSNEEKNQLQDEFKPLFQQQLTAQSALRYLEACAWLKPFVANQEDVAITVKNWLHQHGTISPENLQTLPATLRQTADYLPYQQNKLLQQIEDSAMPSEWKQHTQSILRVFFEG